MTVRVALEVAVDAPVETTWAAATDWDRQGEWMLGTRVRGTTQGGQGVGGGIEAFTGVGRVGFLDTMEITGWEPPYRCEVRHTGRLVRGTGMFEVQPRGHGSAILWSEDLELPLGQAGLAGWWLLRPLFEAGLRRSLGRFATWVVSDR